MLNCFQPHTVVLEPSHSCPVIPVWNVCKPSNGQPSQECHFVFRQLERLIVTPAQPIVKEISTAVAARGDVEIAVNSLRMELVVGSIESQPTGIPLLRIRTPNMQCFQAESRAGGCALFPKRTLGCGLGIQGLYYKGFAGSKVPVRFDGKGEKGKSSCQ